MKLPWSWRLNAVLSKDASNIWNFMLFLYPTINRKYKKAYICAYHQPLLFTGRFNHIPWNIISCVRAGETYAKSWYTVKMFTAIINWKLQSFEVAELLEINVGWTPGDQSFEVAEFLEINVGWTPREQCWLNSWRSMLAELLESNVGWTPGDQCWLNS